jgi:hypothetical protein
MKPFDPTKPVQQRCGRAARIICTDSKAICGITHQPIVAEFLGGDDRWRVSTFRSDGGFAYLDEDERGLINIPETKKIKFWVNVYPEGIDHCMFHLNKEEAERNKKGRFACIEIEREVKEGEGL